MAKKVKIELDKVQETLLLPLWGRATETRKVKPRLVDKKAVEIIERIDYDFSTITENISWITQLAWVARCQHIDSTIQGFLKKHPRATIVNIGCGLDTTYERIDNGRIIFYDLDLPDVIELRKQFFKDSKRRKMISSSFLDTDWFRLLQIDDCILFIAAGVFYYFDEEQIKDFLISLADNYDKCEVFFDSASPLGVKVSNKKVIEAGGMDETALLKWGIKKPRVIETWDNRIKLINVYPMFRGFKKGYPLKMKYGLLMSDILKIMSMVHLRIG